VRWFTVEHWATDEAGEALVRLMETLGRLSNLMVARAAFAEAVRQRPGARILLRQASRVVMDNGRREYADVAHDQLTDRRPFATP
jgi:hypothetical protein